MNTRYATPDDIPELVRIINLSYRVEDFFIDGDRTDAADVKMRMERPNACFIVMDAPDGQALSGAVWVEVQDRRGHFAVLSVDPAYQGKGLARALVNDV